MIKKKDIIELKIEDMEFGGKAYGFVDGAKVIVKHGMIGQRVRAAVTKARRGQYEGKILEVLEASHLETEETCPHFGGCGGCFYQAVSYEEQLKEKERQVKTLFNEAQLDGFQWLPIEGSPTVFDYRNKMEFSFGDEEKDGPLTLGMHKRGRHHDIITVDQCRIMDEDFNEILKTILSYFSEEKIPHYNGRFHKGYLRHLIIRKAYYTGEVMVNLVTSTQLQLDLTELVESVKNLVLKGRLVGFLHTLNDNLADAVQSDRTDILYGQDFIIEKLLGLRFKISAFSFFQTNTLAAEKLYNIVGDFVGEADGKVLFDLYCGTGTIGQIMAKRASKVIGIEIVEDAVKAARDNAALNGLDNCEFIAGDVREEVKKLKSKPDIIILDPPRAGIHPQALLDVISFDAPEIVYVSCNPKTLVADLKELVKAGYKIQKVKCMDMFPHTPHVEAIILMTRSGSSDK